MAHYLVEFVNTNEYDYNFVKLIEADESEIMHKVKEFYVDSIKEYVFQDMEIKQSNWISDEDLDVKIRANLEEMPQGYDFFPNMKDMSFSDQLDENTSFSPNGCIRYVEINDDQVKNLIPLKVNDHHRSIDVGYYDKKEDRWYASFILNMLLKIGYGTAEEIVAKFKELDHPLEELEVFEDFLENYGEE